MALASAAISTSSVSSSHGKSQIRDSLFQAPGLKPTMTRRFRRNQSSISVNSVAYARSTALLDKPVSNTSLYSLLGLEQDVSLPEIKAAYRKMALKYHPDVCPTSQREESTRMFLLVQDAYEQLSDPRRREQYDYELISQRSWSQHSSLSRRDSFRGSWRSQWEQQLENFPRKKGGTQSSESWGARMRRRNAN